MPTRNRKLNSVVRDIAEDETRAALARRERALEDLFEEAPVGLLVLSREGRILQANRAFLDLLQRPARGVIGRNLERFHPDDALLDRLLDLLSHRHTVHTQPMQFRDARGNLRPALADANALFEDGRFVHSRWFIRDISQRKRLERELIELSERERRQFAQELHDGLGQQLGGVGYLVNVLRERLAERGAPEADEAARISALVRNAIEQTRRVARGLSPIRSEPEGLMGALAELAAQTSEWFRVRCRFLCPSVVLLTDPVLAAHLFRIAQEAVNNALKHAHPHAIDIRLRRDPRRVILSVSDDGKGIGPISPARLGLGLRIMQYRAGLVHGTLVVRRRKGRGTRVACAAPIHDPDRRDGSARQN
jgi:PAS domain S-box-containing protein